MHRTFKADFSFLLCAAFGVVGEQKIKLLSLSDYGTAKDNPLKHEKELVADVLDEMASADVLLGYYSTGFDRPYMRAKALEYGFPFPTPVPEIDLYYTAKSNLAISRKSMQNVAYYANVAHEKSPVEGKLWKSAVAGDRRALRQIERHNIADIEVLRDVYEKLRPLVRTHPRLNGLGDCRFCGKGPLQKRGIQVTNLQSNKQRVQCQSCAAWDTRKLE